MYMLHNEIRTLLLPVAAASVESDVKASASFGGELPGGLPKKKSNLNASKSTSSLGEDPKKG